MKVIFKSCVLFCITACIIAGCSFNRTYINEESEKQNAEKVTEILYNCIRDQKYNEAEQLFSDRFYKVTNREGLQNLFVKTKEKLGGFKSKKLIDWKTRRVEGSNPSMEYLLVYDTDYEKYKARESISLVKEDGAVKIIAFNINSDGFMK